VPLTELVGTLIGAILIALGLASTAAGAVRRRAAARLLLLFGIWCVLYGVRLLAQQTAVRDAIGGPLRDWAYAIAFITYGINVPSALFFEALLGLGWKQSIRRVWQLQAVYAATAITTDLIIGRPNAAMSPNGPLVLIGLVVQVVNVWLYRRRLSRLFTTPVIAVAALALVLSVFNANLGRPFVPTVNLEPVGVLLFVIALAYGVVGSVFRGEAELLAVQRELETARQIQRSLLPAAAPQTRGLDVAVQYVPMTAVAGDLYDFVDLGPSTVGILVADVSGHGVPAALVASMVKLAFSTQTEQAQDPARVLAAMNRVLSRQLEHGFVTAIYAVIDTDHRTMTVANAGHPPLLIGRSNTTVEEIHEHGLVLGFMPETSYTNVQVRLEDDDLILLYTDGVTEAQNAAGEFFDGERVRRWLTSAERTDVAQFTETALRDLNQWCGHATFDDDVTIVVARFTARAC
jgi:phosphoserine phosphatase RsbU/P